MAKRKNSKLAKDRRDMKVAHYHVRAAIKHLYIATQVAPTRFHFKRSFVLDLAHSLFSVANRYLIYSQHWRFGYGDGATRKRTVIRSNKFRTEALNNLYNSIRSFMKIR